MSKIPPVAVWALLALMSLRGLARNRDGLGGDLPPTPPEPNPAEIDVPRGGPVWITLTAYSLTSPIIRFRIWRKPKEGKIGTPQLVAADSARVKYTPPAGAGPGEDNFAFEVQSQAGVSAPGDVRIHITDKDPVLVAPLDLDFGEVLRGETARRLLVLQNIGGGLAEGDVRVPDGWTLEGNSAYSIGAGGTQSFTLDFKPAGQRDYTGDVQYTGSPGRATDVEGREVGPIAVTTGTVQLMDGGNMRLGTLELRNRTDVARTVRITPGPDLNADASVEVPAKGVVDIAVRAKPGELGAIADQVTLEGDDLKAVVPVYAAATQVEMVHPSPAAKSSPASSLPPVKPALAAASAMAAPAPVATSIAPMVAEADQSVPPEKGIPVQALAIQKVEEHRAVVACNFKTGVPVTAYRLEAETLILDGHGQPRQKWVPLANGTVKVTGSSVTAELDDLRPDTLYIVRIVGLDDQGGILAISSSADLWTPRPPRRGYWGWAMLGLAAIAAAGAWRWWKTGYRTF
jgi:hypothetical protein